MLRSRLRQENNPVDGRTVDVARKTLVDLPLPLRLIEGFLQRNVPVESPDEIAFFPTPADASWGQVKIRLLDRHTASIVVGKARGVFNYAHSRDSTAATPCWP